MSLKTELINRHDEHLAELDQWIREDQSGKKERIMDMINAFSESPNELLQAFAEFAYMGMVAATLSVVNDPPDEA